MKQLVFVVATALLGFGCATDPTQAEGNAPQEREVGHLSGMTLPLTANDSHGRAYRLRNATFTVDPQNYYYGYDGGVPQPSTVLSTETDPDATSLSVRLVPGPYSVTLGGSWYMERLAAAGPERVAQVVLLDNQTQYTYVSQDWNYNLAFRFGVDGTLLDFRHGDLTIDIGIELPGDHADDGGAAIYDGGVIFPGYPVPSQDAGFVR